MTTVWYWVVLNPLQSPSPKKLNKSLKKNHNFYPPTVEDKIWRKYIHLSTDTQDQRWWSVVVVECVSLDELKTMHAKKMMIHILQTSSKSFTTLTNTHVLVGFWFFFCTPSGMIVSLGFGRS
jgi:hypothetical protein